MMMGGPRGLVQVKMALLFGFGLIIVGAFMPWTEIGPLTRDGLDGDGALTLALAIGGTAIALLDRRPRGMLFAVSAAALALVIATVDFIDVAFSETGSAGVGLYFTLAGAAVATAAAGYLAFSLFRQPGQSRPPGPGPQ